LDIDALLSKPRSDKAQKTIYLEKNATEYTYTNMFELEGLKCRRVLFVDPEIPEISAVEFGYTLHI